MENENVMQYDNSDDAIEVDEAADETEVPAELEGLSAEVVKETLAEVNGTDEDEDMADAEPDSDNKQSNEPVFDRPKQKIPYERFKSEVDKNKSLKAEVETLRAEMATLRASNQQPKPQEQQEEKAPPQPQYNKDEMNAIQNAIRAEAMAISGMTQKDIDSMRYMDDDDERIKQWKIAENMATQKVSMAIQQAQQEQQARVQRFQEQHQANIARYNAFVQEQMQDPNFEAIKGYATGAYFESIDKNVQPIIADAYTRVERNTASPQDIMVVTDFFKNAKNSFNRGGKKNYNAANHTKQMAAQPRSSKVEGTAASTGSPSLASLERMLNEKSWDEIPKEYQDLLKGL